MMEENENWESMLPFPPLLIRNLLSSVVNNADKSLLHYAQKYKILETLRFFLVAFFLFFIRFLPSFLFPPCKYYDISAAAKLIGPNAGSRTRKQLALDPRAVPRNDTAIGRALSQLLSALNDIPVSSRKYEVVRSMAERIIDDNQGEGVHALRDVNRAVMSAAFERALRQLESAVAEQADGDCEGDFYRVRRVLRTVRTVGLRVAGGGGGAGGGGEGGISAEKLAAEVLWLGQKLVACGFPEEAVWRWAAARNLGWLALTAEPRLQSSLVKLTAFLFNEAKDLGLDEIEESKMKVQMQVKYVMLQSWLPLLCRASNGTDAPVLSVRERSELERVLENIIDKLEPEEQEVVLSLWLHHFTHSSSSDWPNLHACFTRWCTTSRKQLLLD